MNDIDSNLPHSQLSSIILKSCFEVMNELGVGFLESVYKNALFYSLRENGLFVQIEKSFEVYFKRQKVGFYKADIVVANLPVGLLVNFHTKHLDYKRLHNPTLYPAAVGDPAYPVTS